jgi:pimeloyl-ACP methyl ester carboxylesterase
VEERWAEVGAARLFLRTWGEPDDPTIVCWPGLGPRAGSHFNEVAPELAAGGRRVVVVDPPGLGASPALEREGYALDSLADLVPDVLDVLGIDRAVYVGFSWGASLGCFVGGRHPDRLRGLVLLDAGHADYAGTDVSVPFDERVAEMAEALEGERVPSWEAAVAEFRANVPRWTPELEEQCRAMWRGDGDGFAPNLDAPVWVAVLDALVRTPPSSAWAALAAGGVPVLLITAQDSADSGPFREAVPRAEVREVPSPTHDVLGHAPAEVAATIAGWLSRIAP